MTSQEFRELQHQDKICSLNGVNFIVHNNHRAGPAIVVAVRTEVIYSRYCHNWSITKKYRPTKIVMADGTYEVQIVRRIDNQ